jgi:hypothetical protein
MNGPKLDELMDELSEIITESPERLPSAVLHLIDEQGRLTAMALALGDGTMVGPVAQLLVARQDPAAAVLAVEARAAITMPTVGKEHDLDKQRLLRGELRVSELPSGKQVHLLMIYGEDRIGHEAIRLWNLEHGPDGREHPTPLKHEITELLSERFRPLYTFRELMAERRMTEYQARKHARERATRELERLGMVEQPALMPGQPWWPGPGTHVQ